jgi:hypothetical protein
MTVHPLVEYFRCPDQFAQLEARAPLPADQGYFRFGDTVCYGRQSAGPPAPQPGGSLVDAARSVSSVDGKVGLPFDLSEVVANLLLERYPHAAPGSLLGRASASGIARTAYYAVRPALPVGVRRHLQRLRLKGWRTTTFPRWPVDTAVETLMKDAVRLVLARMGVSEFPFIWFWPDGSPGCVMMTHDVEGPAGAAFCDQLMDLDESFGLKSSFQIIPEVRGALTGDVVHRFRSRGFEVHIHDLNHDGRLFSDEALFLRRAERINQYARTFACRGFRAGAMYRRQDWLMALDVAFDMSVPNVSHLEPQPGGCCTVMPYFIGGLLELPLTTVQDYSLFHILGDYSIALWQEQVELILANSGLVSINAHPDYLTGTREREVYTKLLAYLSRLRAERHVWVAQPTQIDSWWRNRHEMRLVPDGSSWRIEGPGSERACLAYAKVDGAHVLFEVDRSPKAA